jgi:hypothetical protein
MTKWRVVIKYLDHEIDFEFEDYEVASAFLHDAIISSTSYVRFGMELIHVEEKLDKELSFKEMLS